MKILLTLVMVCSVLILGYASYVDSKNKKRQEITKIVNDAEHSLNTIQHNTNYVNSTHILKDKLGFSEKGTFIDDLDNATCFWFELEKGNFRNRENAN